MKKNSDSQKSEQDKPNNDELLKVVRLLSDCLSLNKIDPLYGLEALQGIYANCMMNLDVTYEEYVEFMQLASKDYKDLWEKK